MIPRKPDLKDADYWVNEYKKIMPLYERFCEKLKTLLEDLLSKESIRYQAIEARVKSIDSFAKKIQRDGKTYTSPLQDVLDLAGLRIIVYYDEDIDEINAILNKEFIVDDVKSIDKRKLLAPDQFGYLSVHNIISLLDERVRLPEWSSFKNLVAEIQIRTVLQHAWATISHTLQYKREAEIPYQLRRKLVRLSGLLELADDEFSALRRDQKKLEKKIVEQISERDLDIAINALTLEKFISTSEVADEIVKIAIEEGFNVDRPDSHYSQLISTCEIVRLTKISALEYQLTKLRPKVRLFMKRFFSKRRKGYTVGGPSHVLSMVIIGAHREKLTKNEIESKLGWSSEYVRDTFISGGVF